MGLVDGERVAAVELGVEGDVRGVAGSAEVEADLEPPQPRNAAVQAFERRLDLESPRALLLRRRAEQPPEHDVPHHHGTQPGLRFSRNARIPSWPSLETRRSATRSTV